MKINAFAVSFVLFLFIFIEIFRLSRDHTSQAEQNENQDELMVTMRLVNHRKNQEIAKLIELNQFSND